MGYYTKYELTTEPQVGLTEKDLETMSGGYSWEAWGNHWQPVDDCKWYEHDEHLKKFSKKKKYKNVLFILRGEGEESGDIWEAYYKNGKSARYAAEVVIPPFKEEDLK